MVNGLWAFGADLSFVEKGSESCPPCSCLLRKVALL